MVITGSDLQGITELKLYLSDCFKMKDLGSLSCFLGIEVGMSHTGYFKSQVKYASEILPRAGLSDNKVTDTPLELNVKYSPTDGTLLSNPTLYRQLVRSLNYLTITRPDISHAVHIVSQFIPAPRSTDYAKVLRILRYIKGSLHQGLCFSSKSDLTLQAYSDSDWAGDITDIKSITDYCVFLGDSFISWRKYRALAHTTSELIWLRWLLRYMGVLISAPTPLYCDNKVAIQITHNDVFHERTKHIEIDCHFTRHHFKKGTMTLLHVKSEFQVADLFTKTHSAARLRFLISRLKMCTPPP
ncbi:uncharacterized protein LOC113280043 [Papaver somniferum]|uniref:uncharacterized protein LOC113280043 n=1 Tax=Papaver somniferum TaxID=3469 RepID=UPI000E6F8BDD|nr:uncharacterized protein LOC113280043 [Papaver somniferum]